MRIAVFGSSGSAVPIGDDITDVKAVEEFCASLGSVISEFPHALLVTADREHTADRLVVDGILAARQAQRVRIWVYHRPGRRPDRPFSEESAARTGTFIFKPLPAGRAALSHLHVLREADVAIIVGGGANSYTAGVAASLMKVRVIPVAAFGGAGRLLWQQLSDQFDSPTAKLPSRHTWDNIAGTPEEAIEAIREEIASLPRLMIVHGRSADRMLVEQILRTQGITDPIVLRDRFKTGETIPERFEREALQADAALVLFTPDDEATSLLSSAGEPLSADDLSLRVRARQNVSLEYGWFWGRLGRGRVLLLLKGELELPSDLVGLSYHSYRLSPNECESAIVSFIDGLRNR
jgi:predicted nucleotide-binding protein